VFVVSEPHTVGLVFDPFDLTDIDVRYQDRSFGKAVAFRIGRHSHPKARPEHPEPAPPPTGIDYLRLIDAAHTDQLAERINYAALIDHPDPDSEPWTDPGPRTEAGDGQIPGPDPDPDSEPWTDPGPRTEAGDGQIPGQLDLTHLLDRDHDGEEQQ
jgi:hypothetical protein